MEDKHPDREGGIRYCNRCGKDADSFYRYWQQKHRGYYVQFCKECQYGPYIECPDAHNAKPIINQKEE